MHTKLRQIIGIFVVLGFLLVVSGAYVGYSNCVSALSTRGAWTLEFSGTVSLVGGMIFADISSLKAQFNSNPSPPTFMQYFGERFKGDGSRPAQVALNETFVDVRCIVTIEGTNGYGVKTLLNKEIRIAYSWAGGTIGENGQIGSFNYNLGPEIAYHEFSPFKITGKVLIDNSQKATESVYLTIPDLSIGMGGT